MRGLTSLRPRGQPAVRWSDEMGKLRHPNRSRVPRRTSFVAKAAARRQGCDPLGEASPRFNFWSNAFAADAILPAGGAPNPARATLADSSEPNTEMGRPRGGIPSEVLPSASRLPSGATVEGKHRAAATLTKATGPALRPPMTPSESRPRDLQCDHAQKK